MHGAHNVKTQSRIETASESFVTMTMVRTMTIAIVHTLAISLPLTAAVLHAIAILCAIPLIILRTRTLGAGFALILRQQITQLTHCHVLHSFRSEGRIISQQGLIHMILSAGETGTVRICHLCRVA